jgi:hypothetical protein
LRKALEASADLGKAVANLLDTEKEVAKIVFGKKCNELKVFGPISRKGSGQLQPDKGDLALSASWGHEQKDGVVMPGSGRVVAREYTEDELKAIKQGAKDLSITPKAIFKLLGETTLDVHLNNRAFWQNVPVNVWNYRIGGYQIIKKWLSYREKKILGRDLTADEARYVTNMVRRIAAIILLQPALDANYQAIKRDCYDWQKAAQAT